VGLRGKHSPRALPLFIMPISRSSRLRTPRSSSTPATPESRPELTTARLTATTTGKTVVRDEFIGKLPHTGRVTTFVPEGAVEAAPRPSVKPDRWRPGLGLRPWRVDVIRPEDFLALELEFVNLKRVLVKNVWWLRRVNASKPAYLIAHFQPQSLAEKGFDEDANGDGPVDPPPIQAALAGHSRLVYEVTDKTGGIRYSVEGLLTAMRHLPLAVADTALPPPPLINVGLLAKPEFWRGPLEVVALERIAASAAEASSGRVPASHLKAQRKSWDAGLAAQKIVARRRMERAAGITGVIDLVEGINFGEVVALPPKLAPVGKHETAIEAPLRLILSPHTGGAWVHADNPVASLETGRTELWHTRLGTRVGDAVTEDPVYQRTVRAIDSPDANLSDWTNGPSINDPAFPFNMLPHQAQRHDIVHLSANQYIKPPRRKKLPPQPVEVRKLSLTGLGAQLDLRGAWTPDDYPPLSVASWHHRATLGRDHYVRVVSVGELWPFRHKAALIEISERKFHNSLAGNPAYVKIRRFIVVRERVKAVGKTSLAISGEKLDLQMPIKQVEILTLTTPPLDTPFAPNNTVFWPVVLGIDFPFQARFTDLAGNVSTTAIPLLFVRNSGYDPNAFPLKLKAANKTTVLNAFTATQSGNAQDYGRRAAGLEGQPVQYAPSARDGDTVFETNTVWFTLREISGQLYPVVEKAQLSVPALKYLLSSDQPTEFGYATEYLKNEFASANKGELFLHVIASATKPKLDFSSQGDRSGGLLQPNVSITGLTRLVGPVGGDTATASSGAFDPAGFFGDLPADAMPKLFGCIALTDLIGGVSDFTGGGLDKIPRLVSEQINAVQATIEEFNALQAKLSAIGSAANDLHPALGDAVSALTAVLSDPLNTTQHDTLRTELSELKTAAEAFRSALQGLPGLEQNERDALDRALQRVITELGNVNEFVDKLLLVLEMISERKIRLEWKPNVNQWPSTDPIYQPNSPDPLVLSIELRAASATRKEASFEIACTLNQFQLNLINPAEFIRLHFKSIQFLATSSRKPDVSVDFDEIEFVGVLSFIETLKSLIPLDGFSDPPNIVVDENGIEAGFSLALPNIAVGVFSLSNMSLGASFTVPFIGDPLSVTFNFCERHNPFMLTVSMFGGGGFFGLTLTPAGVHILEAAFEFGAALEMDFGVASGGIKVVAGIYFRMEADDASLTGYFRLNGHVDVLGLISASLELYLELSYEFASGKCIGRASLTIEVEVLFFSASVTISCEKRFAGANGDPAFLEMMTPYTDPMLGNKVDPWDDYCEAFVA
jgi:hypothetical protein